MFKKGIVSEEGHELCEIHHLDALSDCRPHVKVQIIAVMAITLQIIMKKQKAQTVELQYASSGEA